MQINESLAYPDLSLGLITSQHRNIYKTITEAGEKLAKVSGKFDYDALSKEAYPVVGDWVLVNDTGSDANEIIIQRVIERNTSLKRKASGSGQEVQIMAANVDIGFICTSLNRDFNLRRVERYLTVVWDSGASPVIILTKSDLCEDVEVKFREIEQIAPGVDIIVTTKDDLTTIEKLKTYLASGVIAVFLGSSGVGKSTLINKLAEKEILRTSETRQDGKGRHTTTHRELIQLESGGIVIDTPGLREIQIDSADISKTYLDIDELAKACQFVDCQHASEPGCAVRAAIENGDITVGRLESYNKQLKEASYQSLDARSIEDKKMTAMFGGKNKIKKMKNEIKQRKGY